MESSLTVNDSDGESARRRRHGDGRDGDGRHGHRGRADRLLRQRGRGDRQVGDGRRRARRRRQLGLRLQRATEEARDEGIGWSVHPPDAGDGLLLVTLDVGDGLGTVITLTAFALGTPVYRRRVLFGAEAEPAVSRLLNLIGAARTGCRRARAARTPRGSGSESDEWPSA